MYSRTATTIIVVLSFASTAVFAAGPSRYGMVPKTAEPTFVDHKEGERRRKQPPVPVPVPDWESTASAISPRRGGLTELETWNQNKRCSAVSQCSYVDQFKSRNGRWVAANNYANGGPFGSWWSRTKAVIDYWTGKAKLSIGNKRKFGEGYVGGQLQTVNWHGYGCFEVRMKPVKQEG